MSDRTYELKKPTLTKEERQLLRAAVAAKRAAVRWEEELKPAVLELVRSRGAVETDDAMFSLGSRVVWTYPENVEKIEAKLADARKEAREAGKALKGAAAQLDFTDKVRILAKAEAKAGRKGV